MSTITEEAIRSMAGMLSRVVPDNDDPNDYDIIRRSIDMLLALVAERTEEPVAWACGLDADMKGWIYTKAWSEGEFTIPLYRHAEREQPVAVTDDLVKQYMSAYLGWPADQFSDPEEEEFVDTKRAIEAIAPMLRGVPDGWKLVPIEPTTEMCRAGLSQRNDDLAKSIYAAMLAASPTPGES